jgi:hypothetical protein
MNSFNQINHCEQYQPQAENFARPEHNYWFGQNLGIYEDVRPRDW